MKKWHKAVALLFFCTGVIIFSYPWVAGKWNAYRQSRVMKVYDTNVQKQLSEKERKQFWKNAVSYNKNLSENQKDYEEELSMSEDGMMGYLWIPKIDSRLPIYHGTEEKVLQKGVGHLKKSHLPVGGKGSHCVLTGHRGLPSAVLFSKLDEMEKGDVFYLNVLDKTLAYQVKNIYPMVDKSDKETIEQLIAPKQNKDLVTLITCTPYGVNTHRLMVRGERIPYENTTEETVNEEQSTKGVIRALGLIGAVVIIGGFVRMKTLGVLLLCSVLGVGTFCGSAQAKGTLEIQKENTLTINTEAEVENLKVDIYLVEDCTSVEKAVEFAEDEKPLMTVELKKGQKKVEGLADGCYLLIPEKTEAYRFSPQMVALPVCHIDKVGAEKWSDKGYVYLKYEKIKNVKSPKTGETRNWLQWILQPVFLTY